MSGNDDQWLRTPGAKLLMLVALMTSLVLGVGFIVINTSPETGVDSLGGTAPLTDEEAKSQVVDSARQIVTVAQLRGVSGGYTFLSCRNEHDQPYQGAVYLNFALSDTNAVKRIAEIAAAMVAHGWREAPSLGEHFGGKLTKDGVTSTFEQNPDDAGFGTMRIYGECRNMADHRNDNPAWTDITDQLS